MSNVESIMSENLKLRNYISQIAAEEELIQRVSELKENLENSSDCILMPILSRFDKTKFEKQILENKLELK